MTLNEPRTNKGWASRSVTRATCGFVSIALASAVVAPISAPNRAYAEDIDTNPTADAFQQRIEGGAAAYDAAMARTAELDQKISDNAQAIADLEARLPEQQERANAAARELYKAQQDTATFLNIILSSESFSDFITKIDYLNRYTQQNLDEISALNEMKSQLEATQASLEADRQEAADQAAAADAALQDAQAARVAAQQQAAEEAQQQAEADAAAKLAAQPAEEAAAADAGSSDQGGAVIETATADSNSATATDTADWTSEEDQFVSEWTGRINNYLAGSAMAGQGETFARAAWTYGVDPRWSPAIAYVESSLGAYCFNPYNAWGWGSASWGSWEEAINAHVAGLARGYGYTLSYTAAQKYCPPNADFWYSSCLAQMNSI